MTTTQSKPGPAPIADDIADVRPRLRHDVLFADTGDGVVLRDADEGFVLKGQTAYRFTASLAPFLTGELTVGELCARLDPGRQRMIADFVRNLIDRGFARDARPSARVEIEAAVLERFGPQLDYVEHYADDAANRFLAFRNARVLVFGTGSVAQAAAVGLLRNGVATVDLLGSANPAPLLTDTAAELVAAGCPSRVRATGLTAETALEPDALAEHDFVIASADEVGPATIRELADLSLAGGPTLLPAATIGTDVVVGPVTRAGTAGCWTCAMLRYAANCEPADAAALWRALALPGVGTAGTELGPQLSAMVGNLLAFDLFRLSTDSLQAETDTGVLVQDIATLAARRERLWPHPACPSCAEHQSYAEPAAVTRAELAELSSAGFEPIDKIELGELLDDVGELVGEHLGPVSAFDDAALEQSPIKVSRVRLGSRSITAFDLHYVPVARRTALRSAALAYVGELGVLRDQTTGTASQLEGCVPAEQLVLWSGLPVDPDVTRPWLTARSVVTGDSALVPAAAVYPFSRHNTEQWFESSSAGDGAGASLAEAVQAGLRSATAYQALRDAAAGSIEGRAVTPAAGEVGSELEFLQRTLVNLDLEVELTELSQRRHVSVVFARVVGGSSWTIKAAPSQDAAVLEVLRDLAGTTQLRETDTDVDLGQPLLSQLDVRSIRRTDAAAEGAPADGDLVGELAADWYDVLVVDTTTADLQAQGGIVTARVLLRRPGR